MLTMSQAGRTAQIKVQVTPRLHRAVRVRAALEAKSISKYVIDVLEREMERDPQEEAEK
ncbi:MAG: hypothetical protein M3P49_09350 [Actinomycetota bacterium]|nr:hypothetical protein [Actinomycetota bacterium]